MSQWLGDEYFLGSTTNVSYHPTLRDLGHICDQRIWHHERDTQRAAPYATATHKQRHTFGSIASWEGGPACGYYAATKWTVSGFTESLREEVAPFGIAAVVIEAGYFRTG